MEDQGFTKIDLKPANRQENSPRHHFKNKKKLYILLSVVGVLVVLFAYLGFRSFIVYKDAQQTYTQAKVAFAAIKKQNVVVAKEELVKTKAFVELVQKDFNSISFLKYFPLLGGYVSDAENLLGASSHGVNAGIVAVDSLIPYADVLGLKGDKSFVSGSAQDRIRLAVKTMGKVVPKIDQIETELKEAKKSVDEININRYPNFWIFKKARTNIALIKTLTDDGVVAVEEGKPLIKVLPQLMGESKLQKYLVIFQNDKELRPTGGFITFYTIFRIEEGVIQVETSDDIYNLDASIASHPTADPIILKYLPKVPNANIRDVNLSPDFVVSMKAFNEMYKKSSSKRDVDGIIAIDTQVLTHILDILGEVSVGGIKFNSKNDPRCNCPQVVYELESMADQPVNRVRQDRKAIIGDLLYAIMQKALSSSPKEYWGRLFQMGMNDLTEKHILTYFYNTDAQKGAEALNWSGRIQDFEGDYFHLNDANFGGAKSNMYVKQSVKMEYQSNSSGEITKTVTVTYKNPQPHSDCNLESGGLCLNATLRDFVRLYVPKGSSLISSKGSEVKIESKNELGKSMFEGFLTVNPLGKSEIIYQYKLPFKVQAGTTLPLLIQKQPGTDKIAYEIYVNGKKVDSFDLVSDKQLTLKSF